MVKQSEKQKQRKKYVKQKCDLLKDFLAPQPSPAELEVLNDVEWTTEGQIDRWFRNRIANHLKDYVEEIN